MDRWVGKVALVTGASAGIGAAIAENLVKEGIKVVGVARRKEKIEELSKKLQGEKGKLYALKVDVGNPSEIIEAFEWVKENLGLVHILVNNAGFARYTNLTDGDYEKWKEVFDVNVLGLSVATREAVRQMKENQIDGHIIHINSVYGHFVPKMPEFNVYSASKYAVTALAESLRFEFNELKLKIKITSISPGTVFTEFGEASGIAVLPEVIYKQNPTLKAEDVAAAVNYVLRTPPSVLVTELTIKPVGEAT